MKKENEKQKKTEFSKKLLIQESILIWVITLAFIALAFICVFNGYFGELPWLAAMAGFPWTAYGVSQACYYKKSQKENTKGGITYLNAEHSLLPPINECDGIETEDINLEEGVG